MRLLVGFVASFVMGSAQAATCPVTTGSDVAARSVDSIENPDTGHTLEIFKFQNISWEQAKACVELLPTLGPVGTPKHLATITSSRENDYIVDKLLRPNLSQLDGKTQFWVGGSQVDRSAEPGGKWHWENGEGSFPGVNTDIVYANWASTTSGTTTTQIEPNDTGDTGEQHLTVGRYPDNLYGWNDEDSNLSSIGGFIVEYDTPRAGACDIDAVEPGAPATCNTIVGQKLIFPDAVTEGGKTIGFSAYEFTDPRVVEGKCMPGDGLPPLFTEPAFGGALILPPYLCGSPKFIVVKVDSSKLNPILTGVVKVENDPLLAVPGNLYKCSDPILPAPLPPLPEYYYKDPQYQDVVVWQSTNPNSMFEATAPLQRPRPALFVGAATEATNGCGSTTAKVRGASYFVVGMHIDFGPDYVYTDGESPSQDALVYQKFVELTQYKLSLLQTSVNASRTAGSIKKPDWQAMSSQLKNAINKLGAGDPTGALSSMQGFLFKVNSSTYGTASDGFNYNGDHLMRGENIAFMLRVKIIPYKPAL
jgi:hypothetical protein